MDGERLKTIMNKRTTILAAATFAAATITTATAARGENVLCIRDPNPSAAGTYSAWYRTTSYAFEDKISNAVTLAIWVKDMNAQYEKFIAGVNERWNLAIPHTADSTNRKLVFRTEFGSAVGSGYVLNDGKWHFIVGTYNYDSSDPSLCSQRLYVDGVQVAEKTDGLGTFSTPTKEFSLGAKAEGKGSYANWRGDVNGNFAELSVWNRALSAAQVKALYDGMARLGGSESGLVAYWPLTGDVGIADKDLNFPNLAAGSDGRNLSLADWDKPGLIESDDDFTLPYVRCVASPEWCAAKGYVQAEDATGRSWADPLTNLVEVAAAAKPFERILCSPGTHRIESEMSPLVNHFHLGSQDSATMEPCPDTAVIDAGGKCRHFRSASDLSGHKSGFLLENLTFANGRATGGGSMYFNWRVGTIRNCVFENNTATNGYGGALYSYCANGTVVSNCVFRFNNATGIGGGAYTQQGGDDANDRQLFLACTFSNNVAKAGGGIAAERCVLIDGCRFADNVATNGTGSRCGGHAAVGIYSRILNSEFTGKCRATDFGACLDLGNNALVSNCVFRGMQASKGFAMFRVRTWDSFVSCVITNNVLDDIRIFFPYYGKNLLVRQCLIAGNTANENVVLDWNSSSRFENCTILQQNFRVKGSGDYGTNALVNCILPNTAIASSGNYANILTNCLVKSVSGGTQDSGVMTGDPKFVDEANGDCRLAFNSPCREKGIVLDWMADATDLNGNPRLVNILGKVAADALPDLGCYECQERGELPTLIYMR